MSITHETRRESYELILEKVGKKQQLCLQGLKELGAATAGELAMYLFKQSLISHFNTNHTNPRLIELREAGLVKVTGKKTDPNTRRKCAIYEPVELDEFGIDPQLIMDI